MNTVRSGHPISFSLLNNDFQAVLDIVDDAAGEDLMLEITNSSGRNLQMKNLGSNEAGPASHHFELRFRPGVLSTTPITVDGDWLVSQPTQTNGIVSFYLLNKSAATLGAGQAVSIKLQHVNVNGAGGARGTRVELRYGNLQYATDASGPTVAGYREQQLSIVNQRGRKNIPLYCGFVGPNSVLNDGKTPTDYRTLMITNLLREDLPFSKNEKAPTRFILSFDAYDAKERNDWALADGNNLQKIQVEVLTTSGTSDPNWSIVPKTEGETPEWVITPQNKSELQAGESLRIRISNIVCATPSGATNVYLRYENIKGYWDGQFITQLEKSQLNELDGRGIGIGTFWPNAKLEVVGETWVDGVLRVNTTDPLSLPMAGCSVNIKEGFPFPVSNSSGSLVFEHEHGSSSIVFRNKVSPDSYGYIEYEDSLQIPNEDQTRMISDGARLNIVTTGSDKDDIILNAARNVGIGTNGPKAKLQVAGDALVDGNLRSMGQVGIGTTDPKTTLHVEGDAGFIGKVGIGTTEPEESLDIHSASSGGGMLRLRNTADTAGEASIGFFETKDQDVKNAWVAGVGGWLNTGAFVIGNANDADPNGRGDVRVLIMKNGNVGIGTTNAAPARLSVIGSSVTSTDEYWSFGLGGVSGPHGNQDQPFSIVASDRIGASEFDGWSDERIKNIEGRSDSAADLQTLLGIEVTDFRYKDVIGKGNGSHKKAIAQQVEKVFPESVSKQTDVVPDIYQPAPIIKGWVELATDLKKGERVRLIFEKDEGVFEVLEVAEDKFRADFKSEGDKVFVYGREVDDFRSIDYDAIAMLNVSATQQIKKEKDEEVKALRTEIAELKAVNEALEKRLQLLESRLATAPAVVAAKSGSNGNGKR